MKMRIFKKEYKQNWTRWRIKRIHITMKKIEILIICCLSVLMFGACGSDFGKSELSSKSSSTSELKDLNYQKACEELDFDKAHQILKILRDVFFNEGLPGAYWDRLSEMKGYDEYVQADIYIFREEVTYLMSLEDPAVENRIIKLIMETPLDGTALNEGYCSRYLAEEAESRGVKVWLYHYCLERYNRKCDIVMELAVLQGNQSLAKKVLMYYKDNMHVEEGADFEDKTMMIKGKRIELKALGEGYIWYDSSDKDAAKKRYDEAVKNGVFK